MEIRINTIQITFFVYGRSQDEIIGHWKWADLVANEQCYNKIILPAFRERTYPDLWRKKLRACLLPWTSSLVCFSVSFGGMAD